jgi:hypothetical protein
LPLNFFFFDPEYIIYCKSKIPFKVAAAIADLNSNLSPETSAKVVKTLANVPANSKNKVITDCEATDFNLIFEKI